MSNRTWITPFAICIAAAAIFVFVKNPPNSSGDWASWVQAIGSIAAIVGAFSVAKWQASDSRRQAGIAAQEAEVTRRHAYVAVAKVACNAAKALRPAFEGNQPNLETLKLIAEPTDLKDAVAGLRGIPPHEVGVAKAIEAITALRTTLVALKSEIENARNPTGLNTGVADPNVSSSPNILDPKQQCETVRRLIDETERYYKALKKALELTNED